MVEAFAYEISCLLTAENAVVGPFSVDLEGVFVRARARQRVAFAIYAEVRCRSKSEFILQFQLEGPGHLRTSTEYKIAPTDNVAQVAFNDQNWGRLSVGAYALHALINGTLVATRTFVLE